MSNINEYVYIKDTICWLSSACVLKVVVPLMVKNKLQPNKSPIQSEFRYEHNTPTGYGITLMRDIRPALSIEFIINKDTDNSIYLYPEHMMRMLDTLMRVREWILNKDLKVFSMIKNRLVVTNQIKETCSGLPMNRYIEFMPAIIDTNDGCQEFGVTMFIGGSNTIIRFSKIEEWIYLINHLDIYTYAATMVNYMGTPYVVGSKPVSNAEDHKAPVKYRGPNFFDKK